MPSEPPVVVEEGSTLFLHVHPRPILQLGPTIVVTLTGTTAPFLIFLFST